MSKSQNQTFSRRFHSYEVRLLVLLRHFTNRKAYLPTLSNTSPSEFPFNIGIPLPPSKADHEDNNFFLSPRQLLKVKNQEAYWPFYLQISLARRSTWALVKDPFLRSTISSWVSTGWLEISSNSGLFTSLEVPTEKNWTLLCFSWSVSSFVYSNPRVLNPSVMATTAFFTSARRTVPPF